MTLPFRPVAWLLEPPAGHATGEALSVLDEKTATWYGVQGWHVTPLVPAVVKSKHTKMPVLPVDSMPGMRPFSEAYYALERARRGIRRLPSTRMEGSKFAYVGRSRVLQMLNLAMSDALRMARVGHEDRETGDGSASGAGDGEGLGGPVGHAGGPAADAGAAGDRLGGQSQA